MFVKPKHQPDHPEDAFKVYKVYDPAQQNYLPPEGREVGRDNDLYWERLKNSGDVTVLNAEDAKASLDAAEAKAAAERQALADKAAADAKVAADAKAAAEKPKTPAPSAGKVEK